MTEISVKNSKILKIYLELSQFPILSSKIRERMREELYRRRVISPVEFEQEVEEKAIQSQYREGLIDPVSQETNVNWERRVEKIRDHLTDFYFAYNMPHDLLTDLVRSTLRHQSAHPETELSFNPELAPWAILLDKASDYENSTADERAKHIHHLQEIQVVLTKGLISDQLRFIGISKKYFEMDDLRHILAHRVGRGKIGGKAAGMHLAYKILTTDHPEDKRNIRKYIAMPNSYYIGADVFYDFLSNNSLGGFMNRKYKSFEEIEEGFEAVKKAYMAGKFSPKIINRLKDILDEVENAPLIVRSSSLLEDRFETAFAGKYDSFFCTNQGDKQKRLDELVEAVKKVYVSTVNPDAMLYRKNQGLLDYDERMAVLIQEVVGQRYKNYFFPTLAGVGFSHNPFRWNQKIKRKTGFLRLVWGLGTRAVDRVANDYPRMVSVSHPMLRPETKHTEIVRYSQHFVDVLDLESEEGLRTLPVADVIGDDFPSIQYLVSMDKGDYLQPIVALGSGLAADKMVLTFDNLLKNTKFVAIMRTVLSKLRRAYQSPIDMEYAVEIIPNYPKPDFKIYILQCRPLNEFTFMVKVDFPTNVPDADVIFTTHKWTPSGEVHDINYVVYIDPTIYDSLNDYTLKLEIGRVVSRLNAALAKETFILLGPGRWGSSNVDLGVKVSYGDIFNTRILGEIAIPRNNQTPEVSYGTHFFQDLVEANIYPLPIYPKADDAIFNEAFFVNAENVLAEISPRDAAMAEYVKVINVPQAAQGRNLSVVMDGERERAIGYLSEASSVVTSDEDYDDEITFID